MNIHRNSGVLQTKFVGFVLGYPKSIWYDILFMAHVGKYFPITYVKGEIFIVHKDVGD